MSVFLLFLYIIYACSHLYYFPVCIWAVHFLSVSEAVQEQLYHELVEVFGEEPVTLEKIPQLRWATNSDNIIHMVFTFIDLQDAKSSDHYVETWRN